MDVKSPPLPATVYTVAPAGVDAAAYTASVASMTAARCDERDIGRLRRRPATVRRAVEAGESRQIKVMASSPPGSSPGPLPHEGRPASAPAPCVSSSGTVPRGTREERQRVGARLVEWP